MSEKIIAEHIDPFRFAEQSLGLEGAVRISDMPRLSANVYPNDELVHVFLSFGVDQQGVNFLKGKLNANLSLQCQRCMGTFDYEIASNFLLGIVKTLEEADKLPEIYEPALAQENNLALRELIEDEVILNLPIIPRHEANECHISLPLSDKGWDEAKKINPFEVLNTLKKNKES